MLHAGKTCKVCLRLPRWCAEHCVCLYLLLEQVPQPDQQQHSRSHHHHHGPSGEAGGGSGAGSTCPSSSQYTLPSSDSSSAQFLPMRTTFSLLPEDNPFQDITIGSLLGWGSYGRVHRGESICC